jgi:hypothetical protein
MPRKSKKLASALNEEDKKDMTEIVAEVNEPIKMVVEETGNNDVEVVSCEECGKDISIETEDIPYDQDIPIYLVMEYENLRKKNPCCIIPYLYSKDVEWAMRAKGSTILKIEYKLAEFSSPIFYQALKNSFLSKYNDDETIDEDNIKRDERYISFCKDVVKNIKEIH